MFCYFIYTTKPIAFSIFCLDNSSFDSFCQTLTYPNEIFNIKPNNNL